MGMVVQFVAIAFLNRCTPGHYLYASAAALELTVLHNFVRHLHYTGHDRRDDSALTSQLMRFHLSNGLASLLGNLALVRFWFTIHTCPYSAPMPPQFRAAQLSVSVLEIVGPSRSGHSPPAPGTSSGAAKSPSPYERVAVQLRLL
jgi:putative flippase GtrA